MATPGEEQISQLPQVHLTLSPIHLPTHQWERELITEDVLDSHLCLLSLLLPLSNTCSSNKRSAFNWAIKPPVNTFSPSRPHSRVSRGSGPWSVLKNRSSGPLKVQKATVKPIYESNNPKYALSLTTGAINIEGMERWLNTVPVFKKLMMEMGE